MTEPTSKTTVPVGRRTEFLERNNYRQRRYRDAANWLPMFAAVLMMLPLMWPRETADQSLTSSGMMYLFWLWVVLVAAAFALNRVLHHSAGLDGDAVSKTRGRE